MIKKVAFTLYPVEDMDRAREFYEGKLKLSPNEGYGTGAWIEYDLPQGGCFAITTMAKGVAPSSTAGGSIAFEVEDLDSMVKDLKAQNVTFKMDTFDSPVCRMAIALDSEGNAVILHQVKRNS